MKSFRNIRVIPVVLVAVAALAVLKIAGLVIDGGYVFDYAPQRTKALQPSWAQSMLNFPGAPRIDPADVTGSVHGAPRSEEGGGAEAGRARHQARRHRDPSRGEPEPVSPSERAILERLQARRQELEARQREIDIRESLLKAAEKRIQTKVEEMKALETRASAANEQKAEAENARFKGIVTMYEGMKPKDAAKVFDRLDMAVLIEIASQIAPRKMSDIMGLMQPTPPSG